MKDEGDIFIIDFGIFINSRDKSPANEYSSIFSRFELFEILIFSN